MRASRRRPTKSEGNSRLRLRLSVPQLTFLTAGILVAVHNLPFWAELLRVHPVSGLRQLVFVFLLAPVQVALLSLLFSWLTFKPIAKPLISFVLVATSIATYAMQELGVLIDAAMFRNVVQTDWREVSELVNARMLFYFAVLGVLPSIIVWRARIRYRSWRRELVSRVVVTFSCLALLGAFALFFQTDTTSLLRNHPHLRNLLTPSNYIVSAALVADEILEARRPLETLGEDAIRNRRPPSARPRLVVLVVGETARARQFSLNGYDRLTNPTLAGERVVSFDHVSACGTSTATALPCMFSNLGRADFDPGRSGHREGLIDVLAHAGIRVLWRDNNSGCKGACDRVETQRRESFFVPELCGSGECWDEALLTGLDDYLKLERRDTLIVLHQKGSHGPAYDRRYPDSFRRFLPVCPSGDLQSCTRQEIINAYDNTILYTDHVLSQVIRLLERHDPSFDTAMVYVSDHGESLGEHRLYLHGLPYFLAPEEQTRVPLIVWLSPAFEAASGIDVSCLGDHRYEPLSHDHLFHSMLGLLEVSTRIYDRTLDLFSGCQTSSPR